MNALGNLVDQSWEVDAVILEPEKTIDNLLKIVQQMQESMPCIYYAVNKDIAEIDAIFKVDAALCKNNKIHYLIHPSNEAYFINMMKSNDCKPVQVKSGDIFDDAALLTAFVGAIVNDQN